MEFPLFGKEKAFSDKVGSLGGLCQLSLTRKRRASIRCERGDLPSCMKKERLVNKSGGRVWESTRKWDSLGKARTGRAALGIYLPKSGLHPHQDICIC